MSTPPVDDGLFQRKRLGQFFTGRRLARLLAAIADAPSANTIVDPMGGSGDMLLACRDMGALPELAAYIEIDPRVGCLAEGRLASYETQLVTVIGNAFDSACWTTVPRQWDLVITNPPYVRYQIGGKEEIGKLAIPGSHAVRAGLSRCIREGLLPDREAEVFIACADSYSGLSDLAVPAWLLCCARVAPNGRLAIVAPSVWLSRNYAAPVAYVLRRFFDIEFVIEDSTVSWFPDAQVQTSLIVARRVSDKGSPSLPGGHLHILIPSEAGDSGSIVGRVFGHDVCPERAFSRWARTLLSSQQAADIGGIVARWSEELDLIGVSQQAASLHPLLHHPDAARPLMRVPELLLKRMLSAIPELVPLWRLGWRVGQGLRTGANEFFYVSADESGKGFKSALLPGEVLQIPDEVLRPAIRWQGGRGRRESTVEPQHFVLFLESCALPEDIELAVGHRAWQPIKGDLARLVRTAGTTKYARRTGEIALQDLSAVRTNVRPARDESPARFWYHLPPFAPRHQAPFYIPRVNACHPLVYENPSCGMVIDANFSTLWMSDADGLEGRALYALLSSSWTTAFLEVIGSVMAGGALKIEATHLSRLLLPVPDVDASAQLSFLAGKLLDGDLAARLQIDEITFDLMQLAESAAAINLLASQRLQQRTR